MAIEMTEYCQILLDRRSLLGLLLGILLGIVYDRSKGGFSGELVGSLGVTTEGVRRFVSGERHNVVGVHTFEHQVGRVGVAELVSMEFETHNPPDRNHQLLDAVVAESLPIVLVGVRDKQGKIDVGEVFASIGPKS